jgi:pimeloyl-ACP methyl ester carboxylesterase
MALDFPSWVRGLVLMGSYCYPTMRYDALLTAPVAWPVVGTVMRHTVTAVTARALLERTVQAMFAPDPVPPDFLDTLPRELLLRPSQLRATAEDARFMMPQARALARRYGELRQPVTLIAGTDDGVVDFEAHAERLHRQLPQSTLVALEGTGHMVHHARLGEVAGAVEEMAGSISRKAEPVTRPAAAPASAAEGRAPAREPAGTAPA